MRILSLTFLFLVVSCIPTKETITTSASVNKLAPYKWSSVSSPKTISIASSFTSSEVTNIVEMSSAWKSAVDGKEFFIYSERTPEITNSLNSMDSLLDDVMGIYKTTNWPASLYRSALAVTQIFGRRYNIGSDSEFVKIEHADILVNYDDHRFDTADSGPNYDLRTVILHEMGHFLGLNHKSEKSDKNASVMYPSITSDVNKRFPKDIDIADIASKYNITLSSGVSPTARSLVRRPTVRYEADPQDPGVMVKILFELRADGECVHKIDGAIYERHHIHDR